MLDMAKTREVFEASEDFTVGIEEEFAILDPETRALAQRFDELREAANAAEVLAVSANSPFIDGRSSGLHSARSQIFTKSFPRCGIPEALGGWHAYSEF